jgi:alkylhydroperoxidase family enzyme
MMCVMENAPRVAPGGLHELGLMNWLLSRGASRVQRVRDMHLFSTLGKQRGLFPVWLLFAGKLMPGGSLPRRDTELAILRIAHLRHCEYERDHHVPLGRKSGLSGDDLARIEQGPSAAGWNDLERALLRGVDSLVLRKDIDDATWRALKTHYREPQLIELCMLVGQYEMVATTIRALRIQRDVPRR